MGPGGFGAGGQLKQRLRPLRSCIMCEATGALAIVGVGLRFPGGAVDLESFWQVLSTGVGYTGTYSPGALRLDELLRPGSRTSRHIVRQGGIVTERCGGIRRRILRNFAAGSSADGPAASAVARSDVVSARRCRDRAEVAGRVDDGIVHRYRAERISEPRFEAGGRRRLCSDRRRRRHSLPGGLLTIWECTARSWPWIRHVRRRWWRCISAPSTCDRDGAIWR